jgi:uncharacterized membrane protein
MEIFSIYTYNISDVISLLFVGCCVGITYSYLIFS